MWSIESSTHRCEMFLLYIFIYLYICRETVEFRCSIHMSTVCIIVYLLVFQVKSYEKFMVGL